MRWGRCKSRQVWIYTSWRSHSREEKKKSSRGGRAKFSPNVHINHDMSGSCCHHSREYFNLVDFGCWRTQKRRIVGGNGRGRMRVGFAWHRPSTSIWSWWWGLSTTCGNIWAWLIVCHRDNILWDQEAAAMGQRWPHGGGGWKKMGQFSHLNATGWWKSPRSHALRGIVFMNMYSEWK